VKLRQADGGKGWRTWNSSAIGVAWEQMVQVGHMKLNPEMAWQNQHSARRGFFSPTDWTSKAETSKVLHLEQSFVQCWNLDTSERRSYMSGTFSVVMLEKHGEDLVGPIVWKMKYYIESRRKGISYVKRRKVNWISHILCKNCLLKHFIKRKDRIDGKARKKTEVVTGWPIGNERVQEIERWSTRSHSVENSLWKRLS